MNFSIPAKIRFFFSLVVYYFLAPFECRNFRLRVFFNEIYYLYLVILHKSFSSKYKKKLLLKTTFGDFRIRDICWDLKVASPAFERLDIDELIRRIADSLSRHRRVLFIDIGAQFGKYTVTIGNAFRKYSKQISIYSFEPDPENFALLKENVQLNKIPNATLYCRALSNKKIKQKFFYYAPQKMIVSFPTSQTITIPTDTLDHFLAQVIQLDVTDIYMKLDVETHEIKVLQGSKKIIQKAKNISLLVEDATSMYSQKLIRYLDTHGRIITKKTSYNSFWKLTA